VTWLGDSGEPEAGANGPARLRQAAGITRLLHPIVACPLPSAVVLTAACVGLAETLLMERKYGVFSAGFLQAHPLVTNGDRVLFVLLPDRVFPFAAPSSLTLDDQHLFRVIAGRLPAMDWRRPQFLYINFQAAHYPYYYPSMPRLLVEQPIPRELIGPGQEEWIQRTYWNALAFVDGLSGKLLDELKRLGVLKNTVVVFVGDHGESLYEDGTLGHGHALNELQTRIPFVVNVPGIRAEEPIGQAEVMSLLLPSIGLEKELPDRAPSAGPKAVFQYIGELQNPIQIGLVERNERRLILDLRTRQVFFSDRPEPIPYQELTSELSARVEGGVRVAASPPG
jgi:hypothetical protein